MVRLVEMSDAWRTVPRYASFVITLGGLLVEAEYNRRDEQFDQERLRNPRAFS
jgi:hypothetical protein